MEDTYSLIDAASSTTGRMRRVFPSSNVELGMGYVLATDALRSRSVDASNPINKNEQGVAYDFSLVESYQELAKSLKLDARAAFGGLWASGSASMGLFNSVKRIEQKAVVTVQMTVLSGIEQLSTVRLTPTALEAWNLDPALFSRFYTIYGDHLVYRIARGADLQAILEFSASSANELKQLRANLDAKIGSFSASTSLEQSIETITKDQNVRIHYAQTGGGLGRTPRLNPTPAANAQPGRVYADGAVLVLTPSEFIDRVREFPMEARGFGGRMSSRVMWADVIDYGATENHPRNAKIDSGLETRWLLEDLGDFKLSLRSLREAIVQYQQIQYGGGYRFEDDDWTNRLDYVRRLETDVDRLAASVSAHPNLADEVRHYQFIPITAFYAHIKVDAPPTPTSTPIGGNPQAESEVDGYCSLKNTRGSARDMMKCLGLDYKIDVGFPSQGPIATPTPSGQCKAVFGEKGGAPGTHCPSGWHCIGEFRQGGHLPWVVTCGYQNDPDIKANEVVLCCDKPITQ